MYPSRRGESRSARRRFACVIRSVVMACTVLSLAACGGGSTTGAGTADSPFVGTYAGSTSVTVSTAARSETATEPVTMFVNRDGVVQLGDAESNIYASGVLRGDTLSIDGDAAALVDADCSGTITLVGVFEAEGGGAEFRGNWSSQNASCFGVAGTVSGPLSASRVGTRARASRVFETSSPVLRRVFQRAAG